MVPCYSLHHFRTPQNFIQVLSPSHHLLDTHRTFHGMKIPYSSAPLKGATDDPFKNDTSPRCGYRGQNANLILCAVVLLLLVAVAANVIKIFSNLILDILESRRNGGYAPVPEIHLSVKGCRPPRSAQKPASASTPKLVEFDNDETSVEANGTQHVEQPIALRLKLSYVTGPLVVDRGGWLKALGYTPASLKV